MRGMTVFSLTTQASPISYYRLARLSSDMFRRSMVAVQAAPAVALRRLAVWNSRGAWTFTSTTRTAATAFYGQPTTPDTLLARTQVQAVDFLERCTRELEPLAAVTGAAGTGKTVALNTALARRESAGDRVIRVSNFVAGPLSLHRVLASSLGVAEASELSAEELEPVLRRALADAGQAEPPVLAVDDAQSLLPETLRYLCLLAGLREAGRPLLRILLVGRPGFTVRQPIPVQFTLESMRPEATREVVEHALAAAGVTATDEVVRDLVQQAQGNLRKLDLLLRDSIQEAQKGGLKAGGRRRVTAQGVQVAAGARPRTRSTRRAASGFWLAVPALVAVAAIVAGVSYHEDWLGGGATIPAEPAASTARPRPSTPPAHVEPGPVQPAPVQPAPIQPAPSPAIPAGSPAKAHPDLSASAGPAPTPPAQPPASSSPPAISAPPSVPASAPPAADAQAPSAPPAPARLPGAAPPASPPVLEASRDQARTAPPSPSPALPSPAPMRPTAATPAPDAAAQAGRMQAATTQPHGAAGASGRFRVYNIGACHRGVCPRWSVTDLDRQQRFVAGFDPASLHLDRQTIQRAREGALDLIVIGAVVRNGDQAPMLDASALESVASHRGRPRIGSAQPGDADAPNPFITASPDAAPVQPGPSVPTQSPPPGFLSLPPDNSPFGQPGTNPYQQGGQY